MANAYEDVPLRRGLGQGAPIVWIRPKSVLMQTMGSAAEAATVVDSIALGLDHCLGAMEEGEDLGHHYLEALVHFREGHPDPQARSMLPRMAMVAMLRQTEEPTRTISHAWKTEGTDYHRHLL